MLPCFVTFTYIMEFPLSLGEKPALCGLLLGFKAFEASGVFKRAVMQEEVLAWTALHIAFLDSSLLAGGLQEDHFQTL